MHLTPAQDHDAVSEAFARYAAKSDTVGHYDRCDQRGVPDPHAWLDEVLSARRLEVAQWLDWWGERLPDRIDHVLDAGCGPGTVALGLAHHLPTAHVHGLDVEPEAIELARALATNQPRCSFDLRALEELDDPNAFDLIVCRTTLEHVQDPRTSLERMVRALRAGGVLFLETPNYLFPYEPHVRLWMLPKSPKGLLAAQCRVFGRNPAFIEHLRFACDTITLKRWARRSAHVEVYDLAAEKVQRTLTGQATSSVAGRQRLLAVVSRLPRVAAVAAPLARLPITPSVQLLVRRVA